MALSEFDWAKSTDSWDTVTLQQFERLRATGSSDSGADVPWPWKQKAEGRVRPPSAKAKRARRQRRPTTKES